MRLPPLSQIWHAAVDSVAALFQERKEIVSRGFNFKADHPYLTSWDVYRAQETFPGSGLFALHLDHRVLNSIRSITTSDPLSSAGIDDQSNSEQVGEFLLTESEARNIIDEINAQIEKGAVPQPPVRQPVMA